MILLLGMKILRGLLIMAAIGSIFALPRFWVERRHAGKIYSVQDAPSIPTAIVFGAGLRRDGTPTSVLADRVKTAVDLFHSGKITQILMSGSQEDDSYDEPDAMKTLAVQLGVPAKVILTDVKGTRTYETCRRARIVFEIKDAVLVSQRYHLPRALETCHAFDIQAVGVSADMRVYSPQAVRFWTLREIPATLIALWESYLRPPSQDLSSPAS
jgi:SanA protein